MAEVAFSKSEFKLSTGCAAARTDAQHDFAKTFKKEKVQQFVNSSVPTGCPKYEVGKDIAVLNEDNFVKAVVLKHDANVGHMKIPPDGGVDALPAGDPRKSLLQALKMPPNQRAPTEQPYKLVTGYFNADVLKFYDVCAYWHPRKRTGVTGDAAEGEEGEDDSQVKNAFTELGGHGAYKDGSMIQNMLRDMGVVMNLCVVCDVAYSGLRKDLTFVNREATGQVFYWLQNTQTGFDPAGKTAWHTDKGYGFKDAASNFRVAWTSTKAGMQTNTLYPGWPAAPEGSANDITRPDYAPGVPPETMICSNKTMFMSTENSQGEDRWWDYKTHEARLLIRGAAGQNATYVYADKVLASKASKTFSKAAIASYYASAKRFLKAFFGGTPYGEIENFTNESQVLAKKCGDMPQALSCLTPGIPFCTLKDRTSPPSDENVDCGNNTTEAMAFVSFDRIAVASAVAFCAPIVIYDQRAGGIMFVAKSLMSATARLMALKGRMETIVSGLNTVAAPGGEMSRIAQWWGRYSVDAGQRAAVREVSQMFGPNGGEVKAEAGGSGQWMAGSEKIAWNAAGASSKQKDESLRQFIAMFWSMLPIFQQENTIVPQVEPMVHDDTWMGKVVGELREAVTSFHAEVSPHTNTQPALEKVLGLSGNLTEIISALPANAQLTAPPVRNLLGNLSKIIFPGDGADDVSGAWLEKHQLDGKEAPTHEVLAKAVTDGYGKIITILENAVSVVRITREGCDDFDKLYGAIVQPIHNEPGISLGAAAGSEARYKALIKTLPKSINQNIAKLVPNTKYADIKTMPARGSLAGLDEMERKYGAKFYKTRDTMFQIETLMRPLWDGLKALRDPVPKVLFKAGVTAFLDEIVAAQAPGQPKSFANRIKAAFLGADEPGLRVFAASGLEALEDMFNDPAPNDPMPEQGGGGDTSLSDTLAYFARWDAHKGQLAFARGAGNTEKHNELVKECVEHAIGLDDFLRVFASILAFQYYNYVNSFNIDWRSAHTEIEDGKLKVLNRDFMMAFGGAVCGAASFNPIELITVDGAVALGPPCPPRAGAFDLPPPAPPGVYNQRDLWAELKDYVFPEAMEPEDEEEEAAAKAVEGVHTTEYLFNGLQNQLDNCECNLTRGSTTNFLQCFSKVNEVVIELRAGRPNPYNEDVKDTLNEMFEIDLVKNTVKLKNPGELAALNGVCELITVGVPAGPAGHKTSLISCLREAMAYGLQREEEVVGAPAAPAVAAEAPVAAEVMDDAPVAADVADVNDPMAASEAGTEAGDLANPNLLPGPRDGSPRHTLEKVRLARGITRRSKKYAAERAAARMRPAVEEAARRLVRQGTRDASTEVPRPRLKVGGRRTRRKRRS